MTRDQNMVFENGGFDLKFSIEGRNTKVHCVTSVDSKKYRELIKAGKLNIRWPHLRIKEFLKVIQCFKCSKYGHLQTNCLEPQICAKWGEVEHKNWECKATPKCINYKEANEKYKLKLSVDHSSLDKNCHCHKRQMDLLISRTKDIKLFWMKSDVGTIGNELADRLAEAATENQIIDLAVKTSFDSLKSLLKEKI
ncbi:hypothetical protein X975_00885, partial [Stegodyphus mimosarum]